MGNRMIIIIITITWLLPNLAWTLTPVTLVLGEHKTRESGSDFGRKEVLKERGEERVSLAAMFVYVCVVVAMQSDEESIT